MRASGGIAPESKKALICISDIMNLPLRHKTTIMKKLLFILICFTIISIVKAQSTLTFAYTVDDKGKTTSDNAKFNIRDGDEIKMLVKNENGFNTTQFQYKIYRMSCTGEKTYSTIGLVVKPGGKE